MKKVSINDLILYGFWLFIWGAHRSDQIPGKQIIQIEVKSVGWVGLVLNSFFYTAQHENLSTTCRVG